MESAPDVVLSREIEHPYAGQFAEVYDHSATCTRLEQAWRLAQSLRQDHQKLDDDHPAVRHVARLLDAAAGAYLVGAGNYLVAATDMWTDLVVDQRPQQTPIGWPPWITVSRLREQVTITPDLPSPDPHPAKTTARQALDTTERLLAQKPPVLVTFLEQIDQANRYQLGQLASALHSYARRCHQVAYQHATAT